MNQPNQSTKGHIVLHDLRNQANFLLASENIRSEAVEDLFKKTKNLFQKAISISQTWESEGVLKSNVVKSLRDLLAPYCALLNDNFVSDGQSRSESLSCLASFLETQYSMQGLLYLLIQDEFIDRSNKDFNCLELAIKKVLSILMPKEILELGRLSLEKDKTGFELIISMDCSEDKIKTGIKMPLSLGQLDLVKISNSFKNNPEVPHGVAEEHGDTSA